MTAKIQRETLVKNKHAILNGRYRVRLFPTVDVPILCNLQSLVGSEIVVVDLPNAEGAEKKFIDVGSVVSTKSNATKLMASYNKENMIPEGCTIGGDPLEVSFLTIEKLEKTSKYKSKATFDDLHLIQTTPFNAHLMTSMESLDAINDLKDAFDPSLVNVSHVILADASACQNLLFLARQRNPKHVIDLQATYLGNMKDAVYELNMMTGQHQLLQMRRCVCRCRFDVLRNMFYGRRHSDFREASFTIQAEWLVQLPKGKINKRKFISFENLLAMPPDNAKVVVKFKPGWMDERVELTNNICELKNLSDLALSLKAGKIPWKKSTTSANDDDEDSNTGESDGEATVLQGVADLIERARDRPDIESVYPFDFTDRLWEVICRVNSTETLKSVFEMIYTELRTGEFRVMVEKDKESSLAKMLRVRTLGNMVFPRLEPLTCLQMLVEIGVDRFKGDIQHHFIKSEFITNVTELEPFFLHASAPMEERIEQLMPLYLALQSMLMIEKSVRLTPHKKMLMAKHLLSHFTALKNVEASSKEFSFEVHMEDICRDSLKSSMTEWLMERMYDRPSPTTRNTSATPTVAASKSSDGIFIHEIAFFTKFVGFAHVATVVCEPPPSETTAVEATLQTPAKSASRPVLGAQDTNRLEAVVKKEVRSTTNTPLPSRSNGRSELAPPANDKTDENDDEESVETDEQTLFDCVYVVATNTSMSAYGDGSNAGATVLASKSPSPLMLAASSSAKV